MQQMLSKVEAEQHIDCIQQLPDDYETSFSSDDDVNLIAIYLNTLAAGSGHLALMSCLAQPCAPSFAGAAGMMSIAAMSIAAEMSTSAMLVLQTIAVQAGKSCRNREHDPEPPEVYIAEVPLCLEHQLQVLQSK